MAANVGMEETEVEGDTAPVATPGIHAAPLPMLPMPQGIPAGEMHLFEYVCVCVQTCMCM